MTCGALRARPFGGRAAGEDEATRLMPWLTVVTPSLNQGRFIRDAIESVRSQSLESDDFEHIVVDGGSEDETLDILAMYPHLRVLHDPGLGQSHAVNLGLRAAAGEVIGWLNADDRYLPGAVASCRRVLALQPEVGVVYGNARVIDESGAVVGPIRSGPFDLPQLLNGINAIPQPAVFMRAEVLEQIGLLNEQLHYVMDYELWLRASRVTRILWVDETWADFRKHLSSKTVAQVSSFWPEARTVARAYGGPFFSQAWRERTLNRRYPKLLVKSLARGGFVRRLRVRAAVRRAATLPQR